ncbi:MAG: acyl-CoA dehydrogenase family protein [Actinomycetota bacterium]|nr:acyl-CoA dehydrogenase family protein [Actinomycetota bacterium]
MPRASNLPSWLDEEHLRLYDDARRTADKMAPLTGADAMSGVNRPLLKALGDEGLLPAIFPREHGGTLEGGVSATRLCVLREAVAQSSTDAETALALQGLGAYPILQSASPEVVARWIPEVARGDAVAAFALTEAKAGTDAAALSLVGEETDGGYRLSGTKKWISNAPEADVYSLFARTSGDGARGITGFVVPGEAAGLSGSSLDLVSPHPIGMLELDGVFVARNHVLGEPGGGFRVAMRTLDLFRPSVGAFAVGMAQTALEAAVAYARERHAFGRPLSDFQAVSHRLADMATRTQAARLLVYEAAATYDSGARPTKASAMAKLFATETAQTVIDDAIQIHGAAALQKGHLLEHLYRDVRGTRIYEGTSEIQREIIARDLLRGVG